MRYLIIPGYHNSSPKHWQSFWEKSLPGAVRVMQKDWEAPILQEWLSALRAATEHLQGPTILIAHSLGVALTVHYLTGPNVARFVAGALLVSPSDVDSSNHTPPELRNFAPMPLKKLPVPAIVVASENDPYVSLERARFFAKHWEVPCMDVGKLGHINADSDLGEWPVGRDILKQFEASLAEEPGIAPHAAPELF